MTKKVITATEKTPFKRIASLIFKKRVSGIPVVDEKKYLLGIISEKDLLSALYPSYEEIFDELFHDIHKAKNFNEIEKRAKEASHLKAADLMKKKGGYLFAGDSSYRSLFFDDIKSGEKTAGDKERKIGRHRFPR